MNTSTLAMETHEFIKELTEAGLTEHQSETIAPHQSLIISENLATKHDIELFRQDFERSQQELRQDMALLKKGLFIKLGMIFIGGWVAAMGIILGVMSVDVEIKMTTTEQFHD